MRLKQEKTGTYAIQGVSIGKLMAIRNGLGYAVQGGIATVLQHEVYLEVGRFLKECAYSIPDVEVNPEQFLKEHFNIGGKP